LIGSLAGSGSVTNINNLYTGGDSSSTTFSGIISGLGGVTKQGSGTFSMTGLKNYAGNTSVLGGTLSTNSASLADAADVYLTTGAALQLGFNGADTIRSLYIDGALQSYGTWGPPGSGAQNTTPLLSGTGVLSVPAPNANISLTLNYAGSYDAAFNPLPGSPPAPLFSENAPHSGAPPAIHVPGAYHQFDVYMTITGLPAGEDFRSVEFDMVLGPGVTPSDFGYFAVEPPYTYDPPGPPGLTALFSQNGDAGSNTLDLQGITVIANSLNNHQGTHLRHPGENEPGGVAPNTNLAPPLKLGSAFVFWDGTFGGDGKTFVGVAPNGANPWGSITAFNNPVGHSTAEFTSGPREEWVGPLPGDFNFDDFVNAADYVVWRKNGMSQAQFNTWRANFGNTFGSGSSAIAFTTVPEPTAVLLLLAGVLFYQILRPVSRRGMC
jgi:autotransporter-associated beta strand protein